jgi:hypothetical protein
MGISASVPASTNSQDVEALVRKVVQEIISQK